MGDKGLKDGALDTLLDLHGLIYRLDRGYWVKFKVYRVSADPHIPQGISYSLTLHNRHNERVFGLDNAHPFLSKRKKLGGRKMTWDHVHKFENVFPYEFESAAQLLADFWEEVEKIVS